MAIVDVECTTKTCPNCKNLKAQLNTYTVVATEVGRARDSAFEQVRKLTRQLLAVSMFLIGYVAYAVYCLITH